MLQEHEQKVLLGDGRVYAGVPVRVLVIEGAEAAADAVLELLGQIQTVQYEVEWVVDPEEGAARACGNGYDVCLLAYFLEGTTGEEVLEELSRSGCRVPVIVLTDKGTPEIDVEVMKAGAMDYLLKGELSASLLERSIRYAIARHQTVESLKEKEEDLNRAQAVAHTGSWRLDVSNNALVWSAETHRIFEIPQEEALTYDRFLAAVHPEDRARVDERWQAALKGEVYDIEHRILVGGKVKWVRERAVLEFSEDGSVAGGFGTVQDISELKLAEDALRESEERFRAFMDNSPAVAWAKDEEGRHVYANRSFESRFNLRREDWHLKTDFDLWPREVAEVFHANDLAVVQGGGPSEVLEEIADATGEVGKWWVVKFRFSDAMGRRNVGGIALDITRRMRAEEAVRRSETILAQAGELAQFGGWDIAILETGEVKNDSLYWSDEVYRIFGYEPGGVTVTNDLFLSCVHPEDRGKVNEAVARALRGTEPYTVEHRIVRQDGTERTVLEHAHVFRDEEGRAARLVGAVQDVTERKRAEETLRLALEDAEEGRRTLHAIMEHIPMGVTLAEAPDVRIRTVSRAGLELAGKPRELLEDISAELHAERWQIYTSDGSRLARSEELPLTRAVLQGELVREEEWALRREDGKLIPVLCTAAPIRDREGHVTGGVMGWQDITEWKRAEQDLKAAVENLERSNQELEQFAYVASHDLQEPLRQVTSFVQLLEKRYGAQLDSTGKEYIAYAVDGAKRMYDLVNDLLAYSRVESAGLKLALIEADGALDQALQNLGLSIRENNARIVREPLPSVYADMSQLVQVFQNLVGNAVKFRSEKDPEVYIGVKREEAEWVFWVRDNGIGFPQELSEQVFQLFRRLHTRAVYGGTGIGLAICKRIVERHGGRIWAESEKGAGSTFYFTLPAEMGKGEQGT